MISLALHFLLLWPAALPRMAMESGQAPLLATLRAEVVPEPPPLDLPAHLPKVRFAQVLGDAQLLRLNLGILLLHLIQVSMFIVVPVQAERPARRRQAAPGALILP